MLPMIGQGKSALVCSHSVSRSLRTRCIRFRSASFASICDSLAAGDSSDRLAIGAVLELQQLLDLFERKAELLRPLDEADPLDEAHRVVAERPVGVGNGQELPVLVVADRLDADVGGTGETSDRE